MTRVAVLGAGPAGLAAAWRAALAGHEVEVYERADHPGGMAASFDVAGVRVDHGSHRLHPAIEPRVLTEMKQLLGSDLQWRLRNGRIRLENRWLRFPLSLPDLVRHAPPSFAVGVARDMASAPLRRERADTFAEVVRAGLGPTMLDRFYGPYARKLWGREPEALSGEQARRRIAAASPLALVRKAVRRGPAGFWYPRHGFGQVTDALARAAEDAGVAFHYETDVSSIDAIDADVVFSTIPLTALARIAGGPVVDLEWRALVLTYLVLEQPQWTVWDAHYFPGAETPAARISEPRNYRDRAEDVRDRTVLCVELPCQVGDATWTMPPVVEGIEPVDVVIRRLPNAYPIYGVGFERELATLDEWVTSQTRVVSFGRGGLFAHDNTHHALAEGFAAADALNIDGSWNDRSWSAARRRFASHVVED
jgi:protoporphyrinogen oxidase